MKEASFYSKEFNEKVQCHLCPHQCLLDHDTTGICRVRHNIRGRLISENYGLLTSVHVDPMEKKPLYHFHPGEKILSVGSAGCNMHCTFCQNHEISQSGVKKFSKIHEYSPAQLVELAKSIPHNTGIAYTYNEPTVFYEFMYETAVYIQAEGLKNVMVTNGFIEKKPLIQLLPFMDAFNVDLKAFNDYFYKIHTHSQLEPVKKTLQTIRHQNKHLEITNLVVTELNDNEKEFEAMVSWIADELGKETILHISRYFPRYKSVQPPTSGMVLQDFFELAKHYLPYVYLGNVSQLPEVSDTYCSKCHTLAIKRASYEISVSGITAEGACKNCGNQISHY